MGKKKQQRERRVSDILEDLDACDDESLKFKECKSLHDAVMRVATLGDLDWLLQEISSRADEEKFWKLATKAFPKILRDKGYDRSTIWFPSLFGNTCPWKLSTENRRIRDRNRYRKKRLWAFLPELLRLAGVRAYAE